MTTTSKQIQLLKPKRVDDQIFTELNEIDNSTVSREIPNVCKCSNLFINNPNASKIYQKNRKCFEQNHNGSLI